MPTTLLVENNQQIESLLSINLLTWVGLEITPKRSAQFAIDFITASESPVDLIITKANIANEKTAQILIDYLSQNQLNIPVIILGHSKIQDGRVHIIDSALDYKPVIKLSAQLLNISAQDMAKKEVPQFFPIPINYFTALRSSVTDIYEKSVNSDEYLKKVNALELFDQTVIKYYISEGISHLYIDKNDRLKFVTNIAEELASKLKTSELNADEQINANEMGNHLLRQKLSSIGLTPESIDLAQRNLKGMVTSLKKYKGVSKLIARLMKNKSGYLFKHSQVLMYVCSHLMDHIDWGNEEQKQKIQFITFFHDISLQNDEQSMIHSEADLKKSTLSQKEKELVKKHAQVSAELVQKFPKAPMGSDIIIRQHHGINHGIGFSEHYSGNLSPMAIVFILAEDFTDDIIQQGSGFTVKEKIVKMREKYSTQRFQKIIDVLEKITV